MANLVQVSRLPWWSGIAKLPGAMERSQEKEFHELSIYHILPVLFCFYH